MRLEGSDIKEIKKSNPITGSAKDIGKRVVVKKDAVWPPATSFQGFKGSILSFTPKGKVYVELDGIDFPVRLEGSDIKEIKKWNPIRPHTSEEIRKYNDMFREAERKYRGMRGMTRDKIIALASKDAHSKFEKYKKDKDALYKFMGTMGPQMNPGIKRGLANIGKPEYPGEKFNPLLDKVELDSLNKMLEKLGRGVLYKKFDLDKMFDKLDLRYLDRLLEKFYKKYDSYFKEGVRYLEKRGVPREEAERLTTESLRKEANRLSHYITLQKEFFKGVQKREDEEKAKIKEAKRRGILNPNIVEYAGGEEEYKQACQRALLDYAFQNYMKKPGISELEARKLAVDYLESRDSRKVILCYLVAVPVVDHP